jgi:hypothetical protein
MEPSRLDLVDGVLLDKISGPFAIAGAQRTGDSFGGQPVAFVPDARSAMQLGNFVAAIAP